MLMEATSRSSVKIDLHRIVVQPCCGHNLLPALGPLVTICTVMRLLQQAALRLYAGDYRALF